VRVPLKQSAGSGCTATVRVGDRVTAGQAIGAVPEKALGAIVHAPFAGTVSEVTATHVVLNRDSGT
jgi:Na+-translocating ferredoxin:NAD+ oxidoreductase RnfC subunit